MRVARFAGLALLAMLACSGETGRTDPRQAAAETSERPPNIILLLADDLGWGDLRAYHPSSVIPTPNVDRLAREGMRFTDAHASSSACTPSRYSILTGRYAWRTRLKRNVLEPFDPPLIEDGRLTLPELLHRRGYATAAIGKWHLGFNLPAADGSGFVRMDGDRLPADPDFGAAIQGGPLDIGFDSYFGAQLWRLAAYVRDRHFVGSPAPGANGIRFRVPAWDDSRIGPVQLAEALERIAHLHAADPDRPFFLYYASRAPHTPYRPAAEIAGQPVAGTSGTGPRGDLVVQLDIVLGQLVKRLAELGIGHQTLIILTSDNGPKRSGESRGHDPGGGWRGRKGRLWEAGHRVPVIARWGDGAGAGSMIPPGSVSHQLIGLQDLMATVAELVGAPLPPDAAEDSESFLPILLGRQGAEPIRERLVHHSAGGRLAIRSGDWKLIPGPETTVDSEVEPPTGPRLFNLAEDPGEVDNRYRDHPEIVARLDALLRRDRRAGHSASRLSP